MTLARRIWLSILLAALAVYGTATIYRAWRANREPAATSTSDQVAGTAAPRDFADFTFIERSGKELNLGSLRGKPWVASFFFATCPSFCLQMNQAVKKLVQEFGPLGITFVSFTVNPATDTPERLATYAEALEADPENWLFFTGRIEDLRDLGEGVFKVTVQTETHSDRLIVVDAEGDIVGRYSFQQPSAMAQLKEVLHELSTGVADPPPAEAPVEGGAPPARDSP